MNGATNEWSEELNFKEDMNFRRIKDHLTTCAQADDGFWLRPMNYLRIRLEHYVT
jgi:hypothetical protein